MAYDAWLEGYERALRNPANYFRPKDSVRNQIVGDWIVSAKIIGGCQGVISIYDADTLMEHYHIKTIGLAAWKMLQMRSRLFITELLITIFKEL